MSARSNGSLLAILRSAGLRPTRQRLALARLLFDGRHRHVTAEALHAEATRAGAKLSLATVYNSLHQFTHAGLVKEYAQRALSWRLRHAERTLTAFRATPQGLEDRRPRA